MLGDTGRGVTGDVADHHVVRAGRCKIDDIDASGGHEDEPELREGSEGIRVEDNLVGNEDLLPEATGENFLRSSDRVVGKIPELGESGKINVSAG